MIKIFNISLLLILIACFDLFAQKGTLESESEITNFSVRTTNYDLKLIDADSKHLIGGKLVVKNAEGENIFDKDINTGMTKLELFDDQKYQFTASAKKYNDTIVSLPSNTSIITIALEPKKIDYEIGISDFDSDDDLPFGMTLTNKNTNEVIDLDPNDADKGKYKVRLREDDEYELEVKNSTEYIFYSNTINTLADRESGNKSFKIKMNKAKSGVKIPLNGITFDYNSWSLNDHSRKELDRIVKFLQLKPTAKIEIGAHTDSKGTHSYNLTLSEKRAQAVFEYIITKDVYSKRFVTKGYGKGTPIADNNTEEGRAKNRRFELKILSL